MRTQNFELTLPPEGDTAGARAPVRGRATWPVRAAPSQAGESATGMPWVLVLHGFKGFIDWGFFPLLARRLAENGLAVIAFNTSGAGIGPDFETFTELEAFAHGTISRQLEDAAAVAGLARSGGLGLPIHLDSDRAGVFGHSRGGAAALVHAAERADYRAAVTWAALDTFDRWDDEMKALWRRLGELPLTNARTGQQMPLDVSMLEDFEANAERFDVLAACARLRTPTLAIHGSADETVDPVALERIHAALPAGPSRKHLIPDAGHTFGAKHPLEGDVPATLEAALRETVGWFSDQLLATSPPDPVTGPGAGRT